VHRTLKSRAVANKRSLNNEALAWLEREAENLPELISGKEAARRLRAWKAQFTQAELREIAELTEQYVRRNRNEPRDH
jgi:hypothetical protein